MTIILDGTTGITTPTTSTTGEFVTSVTSFKNRIINGAMVIDQRNAGASITPTDGQYSVDRWQAAMAQASKYSVQQNAGSVTPPAGFSNYLGVTSLSAYSVGSGDYFFLRQYIEGFNFADMAFGTANASAVTLSFRVYSSLTGTFGGAVKNSAASRSYPFSYTISSANTWTTISITIPGDTTGTWIGATNGTGLAVLFNLGSGSTYSGTAGAWASANYIGATGNVNVVGTNGATFYITGVQLEKGSTATSFDYRSIGTELFLCQRYYETTSYPSASQGLDTTQISIIWNANFSSGQKYLVAKRAAPTVTLYGRTNVAGAPSRTDNGAAITGTSTASSVSSTGFLSVSLGQTLTAYSTFALEVGYTASSEL
jgi:hypothetical protein